MTSPRNALDLALAGVARVVLPTFSGAHCEQLALISPTIETLEHDQWPVTHHEDRFAPAVRKEIDRMYCVLRETGAAEQGTGVRTMRGV